MPVIIPPPTEGEYAEFHMSYIAAVAGEADAVPLLERQLETMAKLRALTPPEASHRYAEGKWSVRELIGHLSDAERVFAYRLLRIARGDQTPLPGFDEQKYVPASGADARDLQDLVDELAAVRVATLALVHALPESALEARGVVNGWPVSTRAMAFVIAGHFQHHVAIMRARYGLSL